MSRHYDPLLNHFFDSELQFLLIDSSNDTNYAVRLHPRILGQKIQEYRIIKFIFCR